MASGAFCICPQGTTNIPHICPRPHNSCSPVCLCLCPVITASPLYLEQGPRCGKPVPLLHSHTGRWLWLWPNCPGGLVAPPCDDLCLLRPCGWHPGPRLLPATRWPVTPPPAAVAVQCVLQRRPHSNLGFTQTLVLDREDAAPRVAPVCECQRYKPQLTHTEWQRHIRLALVKSD